MCTTVMCIFRKPIRTARFAFLRNYSKYFDLLQDMDKTASDLGRQFKELGNNLFHKGKESPPCFRQAQEVGWHIVSFEQSWNWWSLHLPLCIRRRWWMD